MEKDLASVQRVRNRLASAPDESLPKILTGLLPRLLVRLDNGGSSLTHKQLHLHIKGIFSHVVERARLNPTAVIDASWVQALLNDWNERSISSWTQVLPLFEIAIPAVVVRQDDYCYVAPLIRLVDFFRSEEECELLMQASWILLDAIARKAGMPRFVDWEKDAWGVSDGLLVWSRTADAAPASVEARKAASDHGTGFFDLLIDLMAFSPSVKDSILSPQACMRMQYRRRKQQQKQGGLISEEPQHPPRQRPRLAQRLPVPRQRRKLDPAFWADIEIEYLRHLKLACIRYALWPLGQGIFTDQPARSMILATLFANGESHHGKIAADYLSELAGGQRLIRVGNSFRPPAPPPCHFTVANSLLMIVLGDDSTRQPNQTQPVSIPNALQRKYNQILGPVPTTTRLRRQALWQLSGHALEYIRDNLTFGGSDTAEDRKLFLTFVSSVPQDSSFENGLSDGNEDGFQIINTALRWKTHILYSLQNQVADEERSTFLDDQCWVATHAVLSTAVDRIARRQQILQRTRNDRSGHQRLLVENRKQLAKHCPAVKDSAAVRGEAYEMFARTMTANRITKTNDGISFDDAILLLRCAASEQDSNVSLSLKHALESLLSAYKEVIDSLVRTRSPVHLQRLAMPLLLPVLNTACSNSEVARQFMATFSSDILYALDPFASWQILDALAVDDVESVASLATATIKGLKFPESAQDRDISATFEKDNVVQKIYNVMEERAGEISHELGVSVGAALLILQKYHFSEAETIKTMKNDRDEALRNCGVSLRALNPIVAGNIGTTKDIVETCDICYEDFPGSSFFGMSCHHNFCLNCWSCALHAFSEEGAPAIVAATCLYHDCSERIALDDVGVVAPALLPAWRNAFVQAFVQQSSDYCFCPGLDCAAVGRGHVAFCKTEVLCSFCETSFCFRCGLEPHDPAPCDTVRCFNEKIEKIDEHDEEKKIKQCPSCQVKIQKNGGCNHMTCR